MAYPPRMSVIDLIIPVAGIGLIVLAVWLTGGLRTAALADVDAARRRIALDQPDFAVGDVVVARDRRGALAFDRAGDQLAILFAVGDRMTSRVIRPEDLRRCHAAGADLVLTFVDLGAGRLVLHFATSAEAAGSADRLERLCGRRGKRAA